MAAATPQPPLHMSLPAEFVSNGFVALSPALVELMTTVCAKYGFLKHLVEIRSRDATKWTGVHILLLQLGTTLLINR